MSRLPQHILRYLGVLICVSSWLSGQVPNRGVLVPVEEDGFNVFQVQAEVLGLMAEDTTIVTGSIVARLEIDPETQATEELTVLDSELLMTDIDLALTNPLLGDASFTGRMLGGSASTIRGIGNIDPDTGKFDASQYRLSMNRGVMTGFGLAAGQTRDLATEPFSGSVGEDAEGQLSLLERDNDYEVTLELPVDIREELPTGIILGTEELMISVTITGTLKARGFVTKDEGFWTWIETTSDPGGWPDDFSFSRQLPNQLVYALGYDPTSDLGQPLAFLSDGLMLDITEGAARDAIILECSQDLLEWRPVPAAQLSGADSPVLQRGFQGQVMISQTPDTTYYRVRRVDIQF